MKRASKGDSNGSEREYEEENEEKPKLGPCEMAIQIKWIPIPRHASLGFDDVYNKYHNIPYIKRGHACWLVLRLWLIWCDL